MSSTRPKSPAKMTLPVSTGKRAAAAGLDEPLLPEFTVGHGGGASVSGAVFNVSTSIVGAGIMSIPAAMRVLGVVPAILLITAVALLSDVSVEFMLRYTGWAGGGPPSYAGIMGDAFGRAGAAALNVCIAFTTTGTLVVYLIIIGKLQRPVVADVEKSVRLNREFVTTMRVRP
jgi:amino acid permease